MTLFPEKALSVLHDRVATVESGRQQQLFVLYSSKVTNLSNTQREEDIDKENARLMMVLRAGCCLLPSRLSPLLHLVFYFCNLQAVWDFLQRKKKKGTKKGLTVNDSRPDRLSFQERHTKTCKKSSRWDEKEHAFPTSFFQVRQVDVF